VDIQDQQKILNIVFLGAFAELRKANVSFVMSVCLSVRQSVRPSAWNNSGPTGGIFMKFLWVFYQNLSKNPCFPAVC